MCPQVTQVGSKIPSGAINEEEEEVFVIIFLLLRLFELFFDDDDDDEIKSIKNRIKRELKDGLCLIFWEILMYFG